jgi:hypothetical protein
MAQGIAGKVFDGEEDHHKCERPPTAWRAKETAGPRPSRGFQALHARSNDDTNAKRPSKERKQCHEETSRALPQEETKAFYGLPFGRGSAATKNDKSDEYDEDPHGVWARVVKSKDWFMAAF